MIDLKDFILWASDILYKNEGVERVEKRNWSKRRNKEL